MKDREFHLNAADRREIEAMEHAIAIGADFRDLFGEIDDAAWDKALSLAGINTARGARVT